MFCKECGIELVDSVAFCPNCGAKVSKEDCQTNKKESWLITFLLCVLVGAFGAHRFYVGKYSTAVLQLLITLVISILSIGFLSWIGCIWPLVDLIFIVCGRFTNKNGEYIQLAGFHDNIEENV